MTRPGNATLTWPLMESNITREDLDAVIHFLHGEPPILTQSGQVAALEAEWSHWLGVKHSVFVNSGASANFITMALIRHLHGAGEIIVPTLTWVSDIASVLAAGHAPVFVDINPRTLGMDVEQVIARLTPRTKAVFLTHVLGFNALSDRLLTVLAQKRIPLIEDTCESHGASFRGQKCGTFGLLSNFSFYFAHHMSTIEGGMLCTNDDEVYQMARMLRSHGMVRESNSETFRKRYEDLYPDLNPKFIFAYPTCNYRSTEINAVIGRSQLRHLDSNNHLRTRNFKLFLDQLDPSRFYTDFALEGCVNYAFVLAMKQADDRLRDALMGVMDEQGIEYRRGTAGGGNQLRQPYLRDLLPADAWRDYPRVEHVHFYGFYIGNYPGLDPQRITTLCAMLNGVQSH